ncbi:8-amino-7-oxononanoate synthase [Candidatus Ishikawella capsulata]|nr:8-amino-7-oxononanoate synthase [Candidatus Ishikawaella capsulata]
MSWSERINKELSIRLSMDALRQRPIIEYNTTRWLISKGRKYLNFSSNDYLGLSQNPMIIEHWQQGAELGAGTGASVQVIGYRLQQFQLEQDLAKWLDYPCALLFNSGFIANQACIYLLARKRDRIIADKLCHASLIEAASYSPAKLYRFNHNRLDSLVSHLNKPCLGNTLVATEGIFSMDGDQSPLIDIAYQTHCQNSWLLVDDAHGIGVIGEGGKGSCWQHKVKPNILIVTFGKAFGVSGAAVLCNEATAEYFNQFSRHLIYSTAMPPAQVAALQAALRKIQEGDGLRKKLKQHIAHFRAGAKSLPWLLKQSTSAIQPLVVGKNSLALYLAYRLRLAGFWITAIRPPTVPVGTSRLRITLTAAHELEDIDRLLEALHEVASK